MKHKEKLLEGVLLSRYKRFFADVEYKGEKITIHVPNTGSLKSVIEKKSTVPQKVWFSLHGDPEKKLKGTLEAVQNSTGVWIGINTSNPNRIVTEAIENGLETGKPFLSHWKNYLFYKPEYKINPETRLDGAFFSTEEDFKKIKEKPQAKVKIHFIEIKNTTYLPEGQKKAIVQFPDGVSERAQKHLIEMMELIKKGHSCEVIFTVQRKDAVAFSPSQEMDPKYADLLYKAMDAGVIVSPLVVDFDQHQIKLTNQTLKII